MKARRLKLHSGCFNLIESFDKRLSDWVMTVTPGVEISLALPSQHKTGRGVGLYLMEILQVPSPSGVKPAPLQFALRYLVTAWSDESADTHRMIADLLFAAIGLSNGNESRGEPGKKYDAEKELWLGTEVERDPIPIAAWTALGVPPSPSFVLRVPLLKERYEAPKKRVLLPLALNSSPVVAFHGIILGPGDIPLVDSRVEIPALHVSTSTDYKGRFHFPCVPAEGEKKFRIKAKGREFLISSKENYLDSNQPLVVRFDPMEGQ